MGGVKFPHEGPVASRKWGQETASRVSVLVPDTPVLSLISSRYPLWVDSPLIARRER